MHQIEIDLLILVRKRKISVSPCSLREIIRFIVQRIFAEDHASHEFLGSGGAIGIRISGLQEVLEIVIMMVGEFHEHEHIGIRVRDGFFDSSIIHIIFVDIRKQDFKVSSLNFLDERLLDIETIELLALPEKQETEHQKRKASEITMSGGMISRLHLLPEIDESHDSEDTADTGHIRQKADKQFACIVSGEKERKQEDQDYYE